MTTQNILAVEKCKQLSMKCDFIMNWRTFSWVLACLEDKNNEVSTRKDASNFEQNLPNTRILQRKYLWFATQPLTTLDL